jgi:hypothetical protein
MHTKYAQKNTYHRFSYLKQSAQIVLDFEEP